jgi:LuxR family maltose regulon positive regulatory protein
LGSVLALVQPLRGPGSWTSGASPTASTKLQHARMQTGGTSRAAATSALIALLEYPRAALPGRQEVARTVLGWAEHSLGHTGEVALMRAHRRGLSSRTGTSDRILRPGPLLRAAGHR